MNVLVTAGPTHEAIDPVRFIANRSSGKMGFALAEAFVAHGHAVTLISGPVCLSPPVGLAAFAGVVSSDEMFDAVHTHIAKMDLAILCAAVADFKIARAETQKIKKAGREKLTLELISTRDILASLKNISSSLRVVGFAAETENFVENAREKLSRKGCEAIVLNDVNRTDAGFASDDNEVTVIFREGPQIRLPRASKRQIAAQLVGIFANRHKM